MRGVWRRFVAIAIILSIKSAAFAATFQIINVNGFTPAALSADNSTLVGSAPTMFGAMDRQGVIWTQAAGPVFMPAPSQAPSNPTGVSGNGSVIIGTNKQVDAQTQSVTNSAWEWTEAGGYQALAPPTFNQASATSISSDGLTVGIAATRTTTIIVNGQSQNINRGYTWTAAGGYVPVPAIPGGGTPATALVSLDGNAVAGTLEGGQTGYIWTSTTGTQAIPELNGALREGSSPQVITADGSMVFGVTNSIAAQASVFEFSDGQTSSLGNPGANLLKQISLAGVTADGSMLVGTVGGAAFGSNPPDAFVWTPSGGFVSVQSVLAADGIDTGNYTITAVDGVSLDGDILFGEGTVSTGTPLVGPSTGWIAHLPEPGGVLMLVSLGGFALVRRRGLLR